MPILDLFQLHGRRALVTGASRGLGLEMARALGEAGAEVVIVGTDGVRLEAAKAELQAQGITTAYLRSDLSEPAEAARMCERVLEEHGSVDILVNNVGGRGLNAPTETLPLDEWQKVMDLNLTQVLACMKTVGRSMISRRYGRIINISSINGLAPNKAMRGRAYEAAKAGVAMLTKAVAADWAVHGITVNAIAPGPFLTDANRRWIRERPELEAFVAASVPMGRWGHPREIGGLVVYLASEASSYMTGSVLVLDGGKLLW